MEVQHNALRDELVAILGAGRELEADTDAQLADAFLRYLERQPERQTAGPAPTQSPHQPHYSLKIAGGIWGATLMFLFLLLALDHPGPFGFVIISVLLLSFIAVVTRAFLYLARYGWQLPRVRVRVVPPTESSRSRG